MSEVACYRFTAKVATACVLSLFFETNAEVPWGQRVIHGHLESNRSTLPFCHDSMLGDRAVGGRGPVGKGGRSHYRLL